MASLHAGKGQVTKRDYSEGESTVVNRPIQAHRGLALYLGYHTPPPPAGHRHQICRHSLGTCSLCLPHLHTCHDVIHALCSS